MDAIIALEALLNEGPTDLKYKIAARAAFLLNLTGIEGFLNITNNFDTLKEYYDMRSEVVHGGEK